MVMASYARLPRTVRIALLTPAMYIVLPEIGIAWVDRIGPGHAVALMSWLITGIVALSVVALGGITCLLVKRLRCWRACSPERA